MYRPLDWKNPYHEVIDKGWGLEFTNKYPEFDVFEKGANAMLTALFKMAKESPTGEFVIDSNSHSF